MVPAFEARVVRVVRNHVRRGSTSEAGAATTQRQMKKPPRELGRLGRKVTEPDGDIGLHRLGHGLSGILRR